MLWVLLFLAVYPEEQKKCQDEIDSVVGNSRHVTLSDRTDLPICEAFICEVQRRSSAVTASLEHRASHDMTLFGYDIPEGKTYSVPQK